MKRAIGLILAFVAVLLVTVAAQAESKGEQIFKEKCFMCQTPTSTTPSFKSLPEADMDALLGFLKTLT